MKKTRTEAIDAILRTRPYVLDVIRRAIRAGVIQSHELLEGETVSSREELISAAGRMKEMHPDWGSRKIANALDAQGFTSCRGGAVTSSVIGSIRFRETRAKVLTMSGEPIDDEPDLVEDVIDQDEVELDGQPVDQVEETMLQEQVLPIVTLPVDVCLTLDLCERIYRALADCHDLAEIRGGLRAIQVVRDVMGVGKE
jgi:hypothetical protein